MRRSLALVAVTSSVLLGSAALTGAGPAGARTSTITYTKQTVMVPTATVKNQLLSVSKNGAIYTFRSRAGALSRIKVGSTMLLQGYAVRDVTKTATVNHHFVATTKPAQLTDLIANGTLAWTKPVAFSKGFALGGSAVPPSARAAHTSLASRFGLHPMAGGFTL